ncbi:MAG: ribonuclease HI family protein [Patescibacteria group bacterium]|nr:ribonuclease HI family protein [Patescibacteria group bacterium]
MSKIIINTDGASRGNPGHASSSFIISTPEGVIWDQEGVYLGVATNNEAEYSAVKKALEKVKEKFSQQLPLEIEIRTDSLLIASQLSGKYKIKNERLKEFYNKVKNLENEIGSVEYTYIPREKNFLADRLANEALDKELAI